MRYSRSHNKKTGVTYVYEVEENYWDKEKKQARNKRKLIGKIDPDTGAIIPTKKRGTSVAETGEQSDYKTMYDNIKKQLKAKDKQIEALRKELSEFVTEEKSVLSEIEATLKARKNRADSLAKKYKI